LADGRELAWIEYGVRDGQPVFAFHGSPGTCHHFAGVAEVASGKGVRVIAPDRPGYGHSTYHSARSYDSWTQDVAQLAEHLPVSTIDVKTATKDPADIAVGPVPTEVAVTPCRR